MENQKNDNSIRKAALFAIKQHEEKILYFSNLLNQDKTQHDLNNYDWVYHYFGMEIQLHRDSIEKLEQWIITQNFNY